MKQIVVLASGRGSNFQAVVDAIRRGTISGECAGLITDDPAAYAITRAGKAGIPVMVLDYSSYPDKNAYERDLLQTMDKTGADLFVLAGYMRILGHRIVAAFPRRIINIHPALLPSFPGLHAQRQAITSGVKVSGCTVHFVDEGMDTGPIIVQECVPVPDDATEESLSDLILSREHVCLARAIQLYCEDRLKIEGNHVRIAPCP
jgi:phosphoribosylglycinamide formyltransferase-1